MKTSSFEDNKRSVRPPEEMVIRHPFFANLQSRFRQVYCDCAEMQEVAIGQVIFEEGGEASHFYLITHGTVAIETFVPGSGVVTLQSLGPGDAMGWSWLFSPYKWTFGARAETPVELVRFDAATLRGVADPEFQYDLLHRITKLVIDRLRSMRLQLVDPSGVRAAAAKSSCVSGNEAFFG